MVSLTDTTMPKGAFQYTDYALRKCRLVLTHDDRKRRVRYQAMRPFLTPQSRKQLERGLSLSLSRILDTCSVIIIASVRITYRFTGSRIVAVNLGDLLP